MEMRRGPALRADRSRLLLELSREIVSALDLQEVSNRALGAFRRVLPFDSALIRLLEGETLLTAATTPGGDGSIEVRIPADHGLAGTVVASAEPVYIRELGREESADPSVRALAPEGVLRSYLGIALVDAEGIVGVLELGSTVAGAFAPDQIESAVALAPSLAIAIRNAGAAGSSAAGLAPALDQDFMSLVAHELRTPLAIVLGCAETMATKSAELEPRVIEDLSRRAVSAGHRLERLIADLFDMSLLRTGTLKVVAVPTSLRSIVARAIDESPRSLRVITHLEEGLPLVAVDPNRLVQILRILLDNAWKHAGENAEVELRASRTDGGVALEIADRGPGIGPDILHKVFDPFVQGQDPMTRTVGGLGIGLYLARRLCELMGAGIEAHERAGGGTTFVLSLGRAGEGSERVR